MGLYATSLSYGPPVLRDADADASLVSELQSAIEDQRSNITIVPGEGSVLGVWVFSGDVYAFRNKSGSATAGMYKSTSTGWSEVDLGTALNFDGTTTNGEFVDGSVVTGAAGATGTVAAVSYSGLWERGAKGVVVLTGITGTFVDDENLSSPTLAFDAGATEIKKDDVITGATSGKTATVKQVTVASGAWADDDAAGYFSITGNTGTWTDGEKIKRAKGEAFKGYLGDFSNISKIRKSWEWIKKELPEDERELGITLYDDRESFSKEDKYAKWIENGKKDSFGNEVDIELLEGDHDIPRSRGIRAGGITEPENLKLLTSEDNNAKSDKYTFKEYKKMVA